MKYRYKGEYREFRGRVFAHGLPVEIDDAATLAALANNPEFEIVKGGDLHEERQRREGARQRPLLTVKGARK